MNAVAKAVVLPVTLFWNATSSALSTPVMTDFRYLTSSYKRLFALPLVKSNDLEVFLTICENERIYCNYLIIPHTYQTKISLLTCCIKTHTRPRYSCLRLQYFM